MSDGGGKVRGVRRGRKWLDELCEMGWDIYMREM